MAKRDITLRDKYKSTTALYPKINAKSFTTSAIEKVASIADAEIEDKVNEVVANPTLAGTEADLTGIQIGETKYKVPSGGGGGTTRYLHNIKIQQANMGSVITCQVITNSNTAFTKNSFMNFLDDNGFNYRSGSYHILPCNGCDSIDNVNYWGLSYYSAGNLDLYSGVIGGTVTNISGTDWEFEDIVI